MTALRLTIQESKVLKMWLLRSKIVLPAQILHRSSIRHLQLAETRYTETRYTFLVLQNGFP